MVVRAPFQYQGRCYERTSPAKNEAGFLCFFVIRTEDRLVGVCVLLGLSHFLGIHITVSSRFTQVA